MNEMTGEEWSEEQDKIRDATAKWVEENLQDYSAPWIIGELDKRTKLLEQLQAAIRVHKTLVEKWYENPEESIHPGAANEALWKVNESFRTSVGCTGDCCG
jgi:hypothetical protein